jgi:hypothetical protein
LLDGFSAQVLVAPSSEDFWGTVLELLGCMDSHDSHVVGNFPQNDEKVRILARQRNSYNRSWCFPDMTI